MGAVMGDDEKVRSVILEDHVGLRFHVLGYDRENGLVYVNRDGYGHAAPMRMATLKTLGYKPTRGPDGTDRIPS